jgi:hypothetical protein
MNITENRLKYWASLKGKKHTSAHKSKIGKSVSKLWKQSRTGKTYKEIFGIATAEAMKQKMSVAKLGIKRPPRTKEHIAKQSGQNHWNWQGGISRSKKTGYWSPQYKAWRTSVFKRDSYTCQECGAKSYITAHHIKSFARYPELRYELSNGLTLCEPCHSKTDNYKGRGKANNKV